MKRKFYGTIFNGALLIFSVTLIEACAQNETHPMTTCPTDLTRDVFVKIKFVNGCLDSVDCDYFDVSKSKRIVWQSSDPNGSTPDFKIYFDPFKGQPLRSTHGEKRSPPFESSTPVMVDYKYTIVTVGNECQDDSKKTLDPRFRLR